MTETGDTVSQNVAQNGAKLFGKCSWRVIVINANTFNWTCNRCCIAVLLNSQNKSKI